MSKTIEERHAPDTLKRRMRSQLLAQRRALPAHRRATLNAMICGHVLQTLTDAEHPNQHIALFVSHAGEPDLMPVMYSLIESGRAVYLPVLAGSVLHFHQFDPERAMVPNRFGILEPLDQPKIEVGLLDWVLMPLVGFTSAGERLGMGGGYYDQTLSGFRAEGPIKAGVAYGIQQIDSLPVDPWDVKMDAVISDKGALWVK